MKNFSDRFSLSIHRAVGEKLRMNGEEVLQVARRNLERWMRSGSFDGAEIASLKEWKDILDRNNTEEIYKLITSDTDEGQRLRSSSPFVGILSIEERSKSWSECAEIGLA